MESKMIFVLQKNTEIIECYFDLQKLFDQLTQNKIKLGIVTLISMSACISCMSKGLIYRMFTNDSGFYSVTKSKIKL